MKFKNLLCSTLLLSLFLSLGLFGNTGEPFISNLESRSIDLLSFQNEDFHIKSAIKSKANSLEKKEDLSEPSILPFFSNNCNTPTLIPFGQGNYDISFSTIGSTGTDVSSCGAGDVNDIWFSYTSVGGAVSIVTDANTNFQVTVSVFTSCVSADIACSAAGPGSSFTVTTAFTQDCTPYLIRVSGVNGATGTGRLFITALASQSEIPCNGFDDDCNPGTPDVPNNDGDAYTLCDGDCDDNNPNVYPGAPEVLCNSIDENCNGMADNDKNTDGDPVSFCNGDCDDNNPNRYPGNTEILCNGIDENCNGNGDDNKNSDGDPVSFCAGDCNDNNPNVYPGATEILCNGIDENCNGMADDDKNTDGDPVSFCNGDCNDNNPNIYPGATEILCNGVDENCNGMADDDKNTDGDPVSFCNGDCDDNNPNVYPGATEILCNGIDENCNGMADDDKNTDGDPVSFCNGDCDDNNPNRYPGNTEILCNNIDENCNGNGDDNKNTDGDPVSFCAGDCDDNNPNVYPGATEILCNGIDENCNGMADDDKNTDGDPVSFCNGDCDDNNPNVYPGATEILCNGIDENCNGMADDDPVPPSITCPGNQSGFIRANCQFQIPDYTGLAMAMDNCGNPSISQMPAPGTLVGIGNHTITLTAIDGTGNTAICTFLVMVTDPNPIIITGIVTDQQGPAVDDGAIDITVSGGIPSFAFLWSNGAPTEDISGLATGTYIVTVTDSRTCTQTADFFVDQGTLVPVTFNFTVFPFGLFNPLTSSTSNRLTARLNDLGLIPPSQPFADGPINYTGLEVFPGSIPSDVSDWMMMRFRPVGSPSVPSDQMAVVVHKDGILRDVNGNLPSIFLDYNEDYWVEVFHLNHLSLYLPTPFEPPPGSFTLNWNFTNTPGAAFDNPSVMTNDPMVMMNSQSGTFWGMIAGNAQNGDFAVEVSDVNRVLSNYNAIGTAGPWDVNRDGQVDSNDLNFLFFNYLKAAHKPY